MNAKRGTLTETGVPATIFDILETHTTRRFTHDQIVLEVQRLRPDATDNTIRVATLRLARRHRIDRSYGPERGTLIAYFSLSERDYLRGEFGA
ncbi:hypothetical protein LCGC14_2539880 [marine sediment metagenome]|uniref:Uncharacterized protein n=1 Tax=marine sediment metagenome TaxID=412755 RepID=A0A0F9BDT6_9ZZZZ